MELFCADEFGRAGVSEPLGALPRKHLYCGSFDITPLPIDATDAKHEHILFLYQSHPTTVGFCRTLFRLQPFVMPSLRHQYVPQPIAVVVLAAHMFSHSPRHTAR